MTDATGWRNGLPDDTSFDRYDWDGPNIESNPAAYDLTVVASVDLHDEDYEFHTIVVWRTADGKLLAAADSGCSCPTPFAWLRPEGCRSIERVEDLDPLIEWIGEPYSWPDEPDGAYAARLAGLRWAVHDALRP